MDVPYALNQSSGILLCNKNELQTIMLSKNNPDTKDHLLHYSIYAKRKK